jgi:PAS domain S-box-containing protein
MDAKRPSSGFVYLVALAATALAVLVRWLVDPWLGDHQTLTSLFGAVALAAWVGGWRPAVFSALFGYFVCDYLFIDPRGSIGLQSTRQVISALIFFSSCVVIIAFAEALHWSRRKQEAEHQRLAHEITQRSRIEQRLATQYAVTRTLAESANLEAAAPAILSAICETQNWNYGGVWLVDEPDQVLRNTGVWNRPGAESPAFEEASRGLTFAKGMGLPGRVWAQGAAVWIPDVSKDLNFPRAVEAGSEGLHGAFGFPLSSNSHVLGVIEFFSREVRAPDDELLQMMSAIGIQIGQFLERSRTEAARRESESRFTRFMQHLPGLAWVKDMAGRYVFANDAAVRAFGTSREQLYGRTDEEIFPSDTAAVFREHDQEALASGGVQTVETLRHPDGSVHSSIVNKFPVPDPSGTPTLVGGVAIDVTDRFRIEAALRESEARFRTVADSVPVLMWLNDESGCVFVNKAYLDFLGISHQTEIRSLDWSLYVHPEDRSGYLTAYLDCLKRRVPFEAEFRFRRHDGVYRWMRSTAVARLTTSGEFLGYAGCTFDIHETRTAALAIAESERRYRTLGEMIPYGVWMLDERGRVTHLSQCFLDMLGRSFAEYLRDGESLLHPVDRTRIAEGFPRRLLAEQPWEEEFRIRGQDGEYRTLLSRGVPVRDAAGKIAYWVGIHLDLTRRKQDESRLREQNTRLRLLSEAAAGLLQAEEPDVMLSELFAGLAPHFGLDTYFNYLVDETGGALRLASCMGISEDTARNMTRLEFGQAVCGTVARERRPITATHIQQSAEPMVQLVKSLGIRAYACNPLLASEELRGTLSFASRTRDTFDDDELEFFRTVSHYVAVACERVRLMRELREADRRKDEFLATLAHELRNPLAPVRTALQVLRLKGPASPELQWGRDVIDRQMQQMTRLIDDLLDVSRITRNRLELRKERVELARVIHGAIETSRPLIDAAGHELSITLPPDPIYVDADPTRLAQVFANLLNNAAKYSESSGKITLIAERQGSDVVVAVQDDGMGIPVEMLPRVFDLFTQVDRARGHAQGGLGIGLTIVKRLVEMHGGSVVAQSAGTGKGSEFIVRLPVPIAQLSPSTAQPADALAEAPVRRRILIVDDNHDAATSLGMMLTLLGYETRTAFDGVAGLVAADEFRPETALLDLGMPRMDGLELARRIRQMNWGKDLVLIAITGWGQAEDRVRTREAGFDHHLVKPVDTAELATLLATAVREGRAAFATLT